MKRWWPIPPHHHGRYGQLSNLRNEGISALSYRIESNNNKQKGKEKGKLEPKAVKEFPNPHKAELNTLVMAPNSKFILTCSNGTLPATAVTIVTYLPSNQIQFWTSGEYLKQIFSRLWMSRKEATTCTVQPPPPLLSPTSQLMCSNDASGLHCLRTQNISLWRLSPGRWW